MRKIFTLSLALGLCAVANADNTTILTLGKGIPGKDEPQMMGLGMSPNGKYVCGSIESGIGYFIGDLENNIFKYEVTDDEEGAQLRNVDNFGLAIGYNGPGVTYSIDGKETVLNVPSEDYNYILGNALTNDGSIKVGALIVGTGFVSYPAFSKDQGQWQRLPMPSNDKLAGYDNTRAAASLVSGDGKVIAGYVGSFGPAIIWELNDAGQYEPNPLFTKYVIVTKEEVDKGEKRLYNMSVCAISNNGKYLLCSGLVKNDDGYFQVPVVYDVEAKDIKIYDDKHPADELLLGLTPTAISDNGTIVGTVGQPMFGSSGSFIIKAGETKAIALGNAFPSYDKIFNKGEQEGFFMPTAISADGTKILGYGYYCKDYNDAAEDAYYVTYVIDTVGEGAVQNISADTDAQPEAVYTLDGQRANNLSKGINIVRMTDGSVKKIMVK